MTRRQWMKAYADTLQMRGLWTRREANRAAEEAADSYGHIAPERLAMAAVPTHLGAPSTRAQEARMCSSSAVTHTADMAVAKLKASGPIDDIASALLERIAELEAEVDRRDQEIVLLLNIEHAATDAFEYHRMGRTDDPLHDEWWDADTMISRMEDLGRALDRKILPLVDGGARG